MLVFKMDDASYIIIDWTVFLDDWTLDLKFSFGWDHHAEHDIEIGSLRSQDTAAATKTSLS